MLSTGDFVPCDVVVGCIGFERSNTLCETLTGRSEVKTTNYLDQDMMYLADAEIDEGQGIGALACSFRCRVSVKKKAWQQISAVSTLQLFLTILPCLQAPSTLSLAPQSWSMGSSSAAWHGKLHPCV